MTMILWFVARAPMIYVMTMGIALANPDYEELRSELDFNSQRWNTAGIEEYTFFLQWGCLCGVEVFTPMLVSVKGDVIERAIYLNSFVEPRPGKDGRIVEVPAGTTVPEDVQQHSVKAVPGLFDFIADAIDRRADDIRVRYHPELGYPLEASVNYLFKHLDDEISFTIREFGKVELWWEHEPR